MIGSNNRLRPGEDGVPPAVHICRSGLAEERVIGHHALMTGRGRAAWMAFAVTLLASCGSSAHSSHSLNGMVHTATARTSMDVGCTASGVSDIPAAGGATVVIKSGSGTVLGRATLGAGQDGGSVTGGPRQQTYLSCEFPFTFASLPESNTYQLVVGSHDCAPKVTLSELRANSWRVDPSVSESYYTGALECLSGI